MLAMRRLVGVIVAVVAQQEIAYVIQRDHIPVMPVYALAGAFNILQLLVAASAVDVAQPRFNSVGPPLKLFANLFELVRFHISRQRQVACRE